MANSIIKPNAADTVGLTAGFSGLGQDVKNSQVMASNFSFANQILVFEALYFYNATHKTAYLADRNLAPPCKSESYTIDTGLDLNKSVIDQCLDYLLTLPQFNGSQPSTLVWIKS
jgi:hypothetical protein